MIQLQNISKEFADRVLFKDVTLTLQPGHRYGLIGPNGTCNSCHPESWVSTPSSQHELLIGADETLDWLSQAGSLSLAGHHCTRASR